MALIWWLFSCVSLSTNNCSGVSSISKQSPSGFYRYANNESYNKAMEDFEEALRINPSHQNAKKYMYETLLAVARL